MGRMENGFISLAFGKSDHEIMISFARGVHHPHSGPGGGLVAIVGYNNHNAMYHKQHKCTSSILTDSRVLNTRFRVRTRSGRWWSVGGSAVVSMWVFGVHKHQD